MTSPLLNEVVQVVSEVSVAEEAEDSVGFSVPLIADPFFLIVSTMFEEVPASSIIFQPVNEPS